MSKLLWSLALVALMGLGVWTGLKAGTGSRESLQINGGDTPMESPAINCCDDPTCPPGCSPECPPDCCPDCPPCPLCR
jgi:hypothetical protein